MSPPEATARSSDTARAIGACGWLLMALPFLLITACDPKQAPNPPSFNIGHPAQYKPHGLYFDFVEPHGILLVSRPASGGTMLVALDLRCPYDQRRVVYNDLSNRIECKGCDSRWTTDGIIQSGSIAKHSLDRLRLRPSGTRLKDDRELYVDTSQRFRQSYMKNVGSKTFEIQEWSATDSMYMYELDSRHIQSIDDKVHTTTEAEKR